MTTKRTPSVVHLQQALREKTREVDVLHRISASISNQLDLEAILKHIVEVVVEVTKADACLLYLLSDSQDELILRASKNPHPKLIGRITIGLGEGITGWVAQERTRVGNRTFRQRLFRWWCACAVPDFRNLHSMGMAACFHRAGFTRVCVVARVAMALPSTGIPPVHLGARTQHVADGPATDCNALRETPALARAIKDPPNMGRYSSAHVYRSCVVLYNGLVSYLFSCQRF